MEKARSYHHGDLRAAILSAAHRKLAREGYEALSLRELARDIGVARSAPYAHFKNREALLWALIDDGGDDLTRRFEQAGARDAPAGERLADACRSYLAFAEERPNLLRLMFVAALADGGGPPPSAAASVAAFDRLVGMAMDSDDAVRIRETAMTCWSTLHGFIMLRLHGRLAREINAESAAEAIVRAAVGQALRA